MQVKIVPKNTFSQFITEGSNILELTGQPKRKHGDPVGK